MLKDLTTEARNPASEAIDTLSPLEIVRLINREDAEVAPAVGREAERIAQAIELIAGRMRDGGRLIYMGAGTSGRLGVLDASECPPTFNTHPEQVVGLIAGGPTALTRAVEGAEDHPEFAVSDLQGVSLTPRDVVVGIATSGRTPYVIAGLEYARSQGAATVAVVCNRDSQLAPLADITIAPVVGPEVISGSTRMKAGTATKLVLNMLTTGTMVRLGKTYGNLMVDLRATNQKLTERSRRIVATLTGLTDEAAAEQLVRCNGEVKTAIVSHAGAIAPEEARQRLASARGHLRQALVTVSEPPPAHLPVSGVSPETLVVGVEGGGTKTIAWIARREGEGAESVIGRGTAGPSNPQAIGFERACGNILAAIDAARTEGGVGAGTFAAACLALAGAEREGDKTIIGRWIEERQLAATYRIVHDAAPLLYAGTPEGWGVTLICGTGSFCYGRSPAGDEARAGGWGYIFGDEGSAYAIATAGLRASAHAADGRGPATELLPRFLQKLERRRPDELIPAIYQSGADRSWVAALAGIVLTTAAEGDAVARGILDWAAAELAAMVTTVAGKLSFSGSPFPLAVTGGVILNSAYLRERLRSEIAGRGFSLAELTEVTDPVAGTITLARQLQNC